MKRTLYAVLAGLALCGGVALADHGDNPGEAKKSDKAHHARAGKADEPKKHLSEIDVYLSTALANTRALYQTTQMRPGGLDVTLQKEGLSNIDSAISSAQTHVGHIKSLPEARVSDMRKIDELSMTLNRGKRLCTQLRSAVKSDNNKADIESLSSQLYSHLRAADDLYAQIAQAHSVARIDKIDVPEKRQVSGRTAQEVETDAADSPPPSTAPGKLDRDDTLDKGPLFNRSNRNSRDLLEPTPHADSPSAPLQPPAGVKPRTDGQRSLDRLPSQRTGTPSDSESGSTGRQY